MNILIFSKKNSEKWRSFLKDLSTNWRILDKDSSVMLLTSLIVGICAGLGAVITEVDSNHQIVFQLEFIYGENIYRAHKFDWFFQNPNNMVEHSTTKSMLRIIDVLGRETKGTKNEPLFYIYDDGTVEKRIVIE